MSPTTNLQQAVYYKITANVTYLEAASSNGVEINQLKWAYYKYSKVATDRQPLCPEISWYRSMSGDPAF